MLVRGWPLSILPLSLALCHPLPANRVDPKSKKLSVVTLPNQDPLEATTGLVPLLGIDVWVRACVRECVRACLQNSVGWADQSVWSVLEIHSIISPFFLPSSNPPRPPANPTPRPDHAPQEHAYYLQYKNVRPDYVKAIWNVMNWQDAEARFVAASK